MFVRFVIISYRENKVIIVQIIKVMQGNSILNKGL